MKKETYECSAQFKRDVYENLAMALVFWTYSTSPPVLYVSPRPPTRPSSLTFLGRECNTNPKS